MPNLGRIIVSLQGTDITENETLILSHPMTAGVVLYERNFQPKNIQELKNLIGKIQLIAIKSGKTNGIPIFADQEGGFVQRFTRGFTSLPALELFGNAYDIDCKTGLELAKRYGKIMAEEMLSCGIISLSPVIDLKAGNSIIEGIGRAFHSNPIDCTNLAESYIDGMNEAGMLATAKHFPGHGQDIGDSHLKKLIDARKFDEIKEKDLFPFKELIKKNKLAAIMPAHITYPDVDSENTASSSQIWLQKILRQELNYKGIVISDCLSMAGAENGSYLDRVKATLIHNDLAILCNIDSLVLLDVLNKLDDKYIASTEMEEKFSLWTQSTLEKRIELSRCNSLPPYILTSAKMDKLNSQSMFKQLDSSDHYFKSHCLR